VAAAGGVNVEIGPESRIRATLSTSTVQNVASEPEIGVRSTFCFSGEQNVERFRGSRGFVDVLLLVSDQNVDFDPDFGIRATFGVLGRP
jgi:hypothetical protein